MPFIFFPYSRVREGDVRIQTETMITNIYVITAISVIGGVLFGFDLSSMSAM